MITLETRKLSNTNHREFFQTKQKEVIFYGGAGAGKSYSAVDKLILQVYLEESKNNQVKIVVIRKSYPSLRRTCIELFEKRASEYKIKFDLNKIEGIAKIGKSSKVFFVSIDHEKEIEKIKSITDVDFVWIEEANEISQNAYEEILRRVRGGKASYNQIILTFNPISVNSWIYDRFFIRDIGNAKKIKVNVEVNPYIEESYKQQLRSLKEHNQNLYDVYYLGEWGQLQDSVYTNWQIVNNIPEGEKIYGVDFGYNNPSAVVECTIRDNDIYVKEVLYETKLTNTELIDRMKSSVDSRCTIYCDSAEADRIQELFQAGFDVHPADKSVKDGILYLQSKKIYIDKDSENLIKEIQGYCWKKDKDGKILDEPVKFRDHLIDSLRYSVYTHYKKTQGAVEKITDFSTKIENKFKI